MSSRIWQPIALIIAIPLIQNFIPYGRLALYPLTLFGTWLHEMGHGIMAAVFGNTFDRLEIHADASGTAYWLAPSDTSGLVYAAVAFAGMIAPSLWAASSFFLIAKDHRLSWFWGGLTAALIISALLWVRPWLSTGMALILAFSFVSFLITYKAPLWFKKLAAQLLCSAMLLSIFRTLDYAFTKCVNPGAATCNPSDAEAIAQALIGPYWLWGGLTSLAAVFLTGLALYAIFNSQSHKKAIHS